MLFCVILMIVKFFVLLLIWRVLFMCIGDLLKSYFVDGVGIFFIGYFNRRFFFFRMVIFLLIVCLIVFCLLIDFWFLWVVMICGCVVFFGVMWFKKILRLWEIVGFWNDNDNYFFFLIKIYLLIKNSYRGIGCKGVF